MLGILRRVFSFTSWTTTHPNEPPPGDMLDATFDAQDQKISEIEALVADVRRSDGGLQNGVVTIDSLAPELRQQLRLTAAPRSGGSNGDELGWKTAEATADVWAHASADWAEYMPDTIPEDSVAVMDVTGDHWSSRWWANQASRVVSGAGRNSVYISATPPLAPYVSMLWWNSTSGNLYVYYDDGDSIQWVQINTVGNILALPDVTAVIDPASLAAGAATVVATVPVTGAALGDFVQASWSAALQNILLYVWVSAANVVSVRFFNPAGSTVDLASGTVRIRVTKQAAP